MPDPKITMSTIAAVRPSVIAFAKCGGTGVGRVVYRNAPLIDFEFIYEKRLTG